MWLVRAFSCMQSEMQWSHLHGVNDPTLPGFPLRNVAGAVGCNAAVVVFHLYCSCAVAQSILTLSGVYKAGLPGSTRLVYQGLLALSRV